MARANRYLSVNVLGFSLLAFFAFLLVGLALIDSFRAGIWPAFSLSIALIGLIYAFGIEWRNVIEANFGKILSLNNLWLFLSVFLGALLTFIVNVEVGLGPVVAASVIAIIAAFIIPKFGVPIYCGAFAGMSCPTIFDYIPMVAVAGALGGVTYVICQKVFNGFGGKLGTIAFIGCVIPIVMRAKGFRPAGDIIGFQVGLMMVACSVIAALATYDLSVRLKNGPVLASGAIGLLGGLILPPVFAGYGQTLAVVAICASFAGMSTPERVKNEALLTCGALLTGLIFIFSDPFMGGAGGKLGTIAFASVISVSGLYGIAHHLPNCLKQIGHLFSHNLKMKSQPAQIKKGQIQKRGSNTVRTDGTSPGEYDL